MILSTRKNEIVNNNKVNIRKHPYLIINLILAGVIMLILAYSGLFSPDKNNYPIVCIHEKITGQPCLSCGISHSFSLIMRGRFSEAYDWNVYGMRIFLFFVFQLTLRVIYSIIYIKNPGTRYQLILTDCIGSGMIFIVAFGPFLRNLFSNLV